MASYSSYKKILADSIDSNAVPATALQADARIKPVEFWVFNARGYCCGPCSNAGDCCEQANGRCCQWTVPSKVTKVTFEIWSGGGGGAGHTCCNNCSFSIGGAGGNYAVKTVTTAPGELYTICAGGSWPCEKSHTCSAGGGCRSFVTGFNLSNFCAEGGCGGWMCNGDAWGPRWTGMCANTTICSSFGSDFGISGTTGFKMGHMACHCSGADGSWTGAAPFVGRIQGIMATEAWCSCGCYVNWPAGGGMSGQSSYCNNFAKCCAAGAGQGGSGLVKVTFS